MFLSWGLIPLTSSNATFLKALILSLIAVEVLANLLLSSPSFRLSLASGKNKSKDGIIQYFRLDIQGNEEIPVANVTRAKKVSRMELADPVTSLMKSL